MLYLTMTADANQELQSSPGSSENKPTQFFDIFKIVLVSSSIIFGVCLFIGCCYETAYLNYFHIELFTTEMPAFTLAFSSLVPVLAFLNSFIIVVPLVIGAAGAVVFLMFWSAKYRAFLDRRRQQLQSLWAKLSDRVFKTISWLFLKVAIYIMLAAQLLVIGPFRVGTNRAKKVFSDPQHNAKLVTLTLKTDASTAKVTDLQAANDSKSLYLVVQTKDLIVLFKQEIPLPKYPSSLLSPGPRLSHFAYSKSTRLLMLTLAETIIYRLADSPGIVQKIYKLVDRHDDVAVARLLSLRRAHAGIDAGRTGEPLGMNRTQQVVRNSIYHGGQCASRLVLHVTNHQLSIDPLKP